MGIKFQLGKIEGKNVLETSRTTMNMSLILQNCTFKSN